MSEILTYTGKLIDPFNMCEGDICIEDIAHSLSNQSRFLGHVSHFYSVAEHCIRISDYLPDELKLQGLLHDSTEAYICDIPGPWKEHVYILGTPYKFWEDLILIKIFKALNIPFDILSDVVRKVDSHMLSTEARDLMPDHSVWETYPKPFPQKLAGWFPVKAEHEFLERFEKCITSI